MRRRRVLPTLVLVAALCSCSRPPGPERLPTVPVRGSVTINGLPAPSVTVRFHALDGRKDEAGVYAAHPEALTDGDGTFVLSTYEHGDGAAPGEYAVTLEWLKFNALRNSYGPPDRLGGKYADPAKTPFKVKVEEGKGGDGIELEPFALSTK
jgi:hypothetical protein